MSSTHFLIWITPPLNISEKTALASRLAELASTSGVTPGTAAFSDGTDPKPATLLTLPLSAPEEALLVRFKEALLREAAHAGTESTCERKGPPDAAAPVRAFSIQSAGVRTAVKKLLCFDMDSTLINQEVIDEMAGVFGFQPEVARITEAAMQGQLDFKQALAARVALFRGLPRAQTLSIIPRLEVSPGGEALLQTTKQLGMKTAVVSGGFDFILEPFQRRLGLDHACGNSLPLDPNGAFLGTVNEPIVDAARKRELVRGFQVTHGIRTEETITVGDGANDALMMEAAGISVSFCGKPALAKACNSFIFDRNLFWIKHLL
jgi:phosphoserine phosphatase SerB